LNKPNEVLNIIDINSSILPTFQPLNKPNEVLNIIDINSSILPTFQPLNKPNEVLNIIDINSSILPTFQPLNKPNEVLNIIDINSSNLPTFQPLNKPNEVLNIIDINSSILPTFQPLNKPNEVLIIDTKNLPDADYILKHTTNRVQLLNLIFNRHNKEEDMLEGEWMFTIPYLNTIKSVKVYLYPEKNIDKQGELKTSKSPSELINTKLYGFGSFVCNSPNCKIWRIIPVDYNDDSIVFSTFYNEMDDRKIAYIFYNPDNPLKVGMIIGAVYLANLNGLAYSDSVKPAFLKLLSSIDKNSITIKGFENPHLTRLI
jgi:putative methionine-R-sulfoxide reductase with GAF domain